MVQDITSQQRPAWPTLSCGSHFASEGTIPAQNDVSKPKARLSPYRPSKLAGTPPAAQASGPAGVSQAGGSVAGDGQHCPHLAGYSGGKLREAGYQWGGPVLHQEVFAHPDGRAASYTVGTLRREGFPIRPISWKIIR